jgi:hypothetical protein
MIIIARSRSILSCSVEIGTGGSWVRIKQAGHTTASRQINVRQTWRWQSRGRPHMTASVFEVAKQNIGHFLRLNARICRLKSASGDNNVGTSLAIKMVAYIVITSVAEIIEHNSAVRHA